MLDFCPSLAGPTTNSNRSEAWSVEPFITCKMVAQADPVTASSGGSALRSLWNHGAVARIVDPKPWFRARRDEQLERLEALLANAASEAERSEVVERMAEVRREYRREVRGSRPIRW